LRGVLPQIRARGAELVVVGNGQPFHAVHFREDHNIDFPLLVDPELKAYQAAGLRRGVKTAIKAGVLKNAWRAMRGGYRQGRTQGDPWQQGGVFIITPDGQVKYSYVSQEAGDHPAPEDVLAAL
jgi:peroxiredoxin